jgi:predicted DsbA family dithiol-disulfide isomerase
MATRVIHVDVVSDTICPWCFVGKRRLLAGLALARAAASPPQQLELELRWRPFFLDDTLPGGAGVDKSARYAAKFGAARVAAMLPMMARVGAAEGIAFAFGGNTGATLDSHRLAEWARRRGGAPLADALTEEVFRRTFEREQCPSDHAVLADAAAAAGLDRAAASAFLASGELAREVRAEAAEWRARHAITGVPFFVFDGGAEVVAGAQDASVFAAVLLRLARRAPPAPEAEVGEGEGGAGRAKESRRRRARHTHWQAACSRESGGWSRGSVGTLSRREQSVLLSDHPQQVRIAPATQPPLRAFFDHGTYGCTVSRVHHRGHRHPPVVPAECRCF